METGDIKMTKHIITILLITALTATATVTSFFNPYETPRARSLGGAITALIDASSIHINPGALSHEQKSVIDLVQYQSFETNHYGVYMRSSSLKNWSWGVAISTAVVDNIQETTQVNNAIEKTGKTFNYAGTVAAIAIATPKIWNTSIGLTTSIIQEFLYGQKGSGVGIDIGILSKPVKWLSFGVSALNINTPHIQWSTNRTSRLTPVYTIGTAFYLRDITVSISGVHRNGENIDVLLGGEVEFLNLLAFRGGLSSCTTHLGIGISLVGFDINASYAIEKEIVLDNHYRLSLGVNL